MNNFGRNLLVWVLLLVMLGGLYNMMQGANPPVPGPTIPFSDFLSEVDAKKVSDITILPAAKHQSHRYAGRQECAHCGAAR